MRYIQAVVTDEDHRLFRHFASNHDMTLSDLVETATKEYIKLKGKEEGKGEVLEDDKRFCIDTSNFGK